MTVFSFNLFSNKYRTKTKKKKFHSFYYIVRQILNAKILKIIFGKTIASLL